LFGWFNQSVFVLEEFKLPFAIPNQSYGRTKADMLRGRKLKAEGRKAGIPDIFVPVPNEEYNGLFIEMKTKYNKPSSDQIYWLNEVFRQSFDTIVAYSAIDAYNHVCEYFSKIEGLSKEQRSNLLNLRRI
jgi:hypothetical protein